MATPTMDQLEEALESIREKHPEGEHSAIIWDWHGGRAGQLRLTGSPAEIGIVKGVKKPCDIPAAIIKLSEQLTPKERKWMAGDIVVVAPENVHFTGIKIGKHYILLRRNDSGSKWRLVGLPGEGHYYNASALHNLTVEAEKLAAEMVQW